MNWEDGKLLLAVSRQGQMLGAAKRLGLNQATLSRRIAALEAELGTQLVIRHAHGCTLTADGTALVTRLERVESEMLLARADLQQTGTQVSGVVRIGAPDGFGVKFLAPKLALLAEQQKGLTLQLVPVPRSFSLSEREADIAVMVGRPETGRLVARKLTDYTLGLYAAPDYLARFGTPETLDDLGTGHRLVGHVDDLIYAPGLNYSREFLRHWQSAIEISSAIGQTEAVRGGAGIGVLHDYLALGDPGLVRVLPQTFIARAYWVAMHESLRNVERVRVVARFLAEIVRENQRAFTRG
ncbi:LysR family transcriptional regulator [Mariluticola halotolerans]|uniref:LysR family transcriptional regulator n=1 Tax=Mariluticola halotolerans TaxID=2909283 RepID=UPI0026E2F0B2|nr:LysR family transcriptional regulator [Mariluticola halotolerans]UJQ93236.1 LysR family transcriptional regulator [Mariluticola halotolerans]